MTDTAFVTPSVPITQWSDAEKLGEAMRRSLPRLGPEARDRVAQLLTLEALAIVAAVIVVWIGAHFFGVGFIADAIMLIAGLVAIGTAVFQGLDHLYDFASVALKAQSEQDLDIAGEHFADSVAILGIEAVLAVIFRGALKTYRGGRVPVGPRPADAAGLTYRPPLRGTRTPHHLGELPGTPPHALIGRGVTEPFGGIYIFRPRLADYPVSSRAAILNETRLAARHEAVHRALTPKLRVLWQFRVETRMASYSYSSLLRYLEEALAETIAQVGVNGFSRAFAGVRFPVQGGYVTILRRRPDMGAPVLTEVGGMVAGSILVYGVRFDVSTHVGSMPTEEAQR